MSDTPLWEKLVGLVGMLLVVGTISFLLWTAVTSEEGAPEFDFEIHQISASGTRFLVLLDVRNTGDLTASDLGVEARLHTREGSTESAEARIGYLPAGSTRQVGVYFDADPAEGDLAFRALGYQKP
ncbi:MAG: hypothetical protein WD071_14745 [Pseudohongiella sp.]|uniref:hypothetical protein n=1 Tax=Pseudohongiella sp. TaxID=1979412 RepID=UPI0034A0A45B